MKKKTKKVRGKRPYKKKAVKKVDFKGSELHKEIFNLASDVVREYLDKPIWTYREHYFWAWDNYQMKYVWCCQPEYLLKV